MTCGREQSAREGSLRSGPVGRGPMDRCDEAMISTRQTDRRASALLQKCLIGALSESCCFVFFHSLIGSCSAYSVQVNYKAALFLRRYAIESQSVGLVTDTFGAHACATETMANISSVMLGANQTLLAMFDSFDILFCTEILEVCFQTQLSCFNFMIVLRVQSDGKSTVQCRTT